MNKILRTNLSNCLTKWIRTRNLQTLQSVNPVPIPIFTSIPNISSMLQPHIPLPQPCLRYENYTKIITELPVTGTIIHIENPKSFLKEEIIDGRNSLEIIQTPAVDNIQDIQAARLIVIRKRKMKKHKLKKLRKKMKFEWAKVRQRREMRKEKAFQAVLISQIKEAEKFSAENYVMEKLKEVNTVPLPRFWKGKRLPAFIIKEKLGIK